MIKLLLILFQLVTVENIGQNDNEKLCGFKGLTVSANEDLKKFKQNALPESAINTGQVIWPDCETAGKNIVRDVKGDLLRKEMVWINQYITREALNNIQTNIFLTGMVNDDDWIINRYVTGEHYFQFIDGRSLTVTMKVNFSIKDTNAILKKIQNSIRGYLRLDLTKMNMNVFNFDTGQIDIKLKMPISKIVNKPLIRIWSNGSYLVIDIPKMNQLFIDKYGCSIEHTVGGLPFNDPRPFHRFRIKGNIDMYKEFLKYYPWIEDSNKIWKKRIEGGGRPVERYKEK